MRGRVEVTEEDYATGSEVEIVVKYAPGLEEEARRVLTRAYEEALVRMGDR